MPLLESSPTKKREPKGVGDKPTTEITAFRSNDYLIGYTFYYRCFDSAQHDIMVVYFFAFAYLSPTKKNNNQLLENPDSYRDQQREKPTSQISTN